MDYDGLKKTVKKSRRVFQDELGLFRELNPEAAQKMLENRLVVNIDTSDYTGSFVMADYINVIAQWFENNTDDWWSVHYDQNQYGNKYSFTVMISDEKILSLFKMRWG